MGALDAIGEGVEYLSQDRGALIIPGSLIGVGYALEVLARGNSDLKSLLLSNIAPGEITQEPVSWKITLLAYAVMLFVSLFIAPYIVERYRAFRNGQNVTEGALTGQALRKMPGVFVASLVYGVVYTIITLIAMAPLILIALVIPAIGLILAIVLGIPLGLWIGGALETAIPAYLWIEDFGAGFDVLSTAWKNKVDFAIFGLMVGLVALAGYLVGGIAFIVFAFAGAGLVGGFIFGVVLGAVNIVTTVAAIEFLRDVGGISEGWSGGNATTHDDVLVNYDPLMGAGRY